MCITTETKQSGGMNAIVIVLTLCAIALVAELAVIIAQDGGDKNNGALYTSAAAQLPPIVVNTVSSPATGEVALASAVGGVFPTTGPPEGENPCQGKKADLGNVKCVVDAINNVGPQAVANITKGYNGEMEVDHVPIATAYWKKGMCPVNVHWHLGAEHYSLGEYDENGKSPTEESHVRVGFLCNHFDPLDARFTTPYHWQHCTNMEVGQTYEVHWPHSAAGACGTLNQYQTPFYDGVFCRDSVLTDTASQIGVQGQVFTIINDEDYYYPDLMRGMIVDGEYGKDIAIYAGSSTGKCSQYSPITWQVDRKCHLVSASTFDKMCADMKAQRDDMNEDLHPHGSRELVADLGVPKMTT